MTKKHTLHGLLAMVLIVALLVLMAVPSGISTWLRAESGDTAPYTFSMSAMDGYSSGWYGFYAAWDTTAYKYRDHILAGFDMYAEESSSSIWGPLTNHQIGNAACSYFGYTYNGWLRRHTQTDVGSKTFDKITSLVPKCATRYRNFETAFTMDFAAEYTFGGAFLAFRQQTSGKFIAGTDAINKDMAFVSVTREGVTIEGGESTDDTYYNAQEYAFDTALPTGVTAVKVTVKVVGDQCYVTVTSTDGSTKYFEKTETVLYTNVGYLAYGVSGKANTIGLGQITLQHLDDDGNKIGLSDIAEGEKEPDAPFTFSMSAMDGYSSGWVPFYSAWTDAYYAYRDYVLADFDMYAQESSSSIWGPLVNHQIGNAACSYFGITYGGYLRRWTQTDVGTKTFDKVTSLVPKSLDRYCNFETTFTLDFESNYTFGGVILAFRQQVPGRFIADVDVINKSMAFVSVTREGVTIEGGKSINDTYYNTQEYAFDTALPTNVTAVRVTVRAVGDQCYVTVTSIDGNTKYFEKTETVLYTKAGYLAYGVSGKANTIGLGDIVLQHLDENGNKIGLTDCTDEEGTGESVVVADPENTVVYDFSDGAQLDDFHSYYIPVAFSGYDIIDSQANSEWVITDGKLKRNQSVFHQPDAVYRSADGVEIAGNHYQCDWVYGWNANFGSLLLDKQAYKNFELTVEYTSEDTFWPVIGFGAGGNLSDVFCTQDGGGYAVYIEQSGSSGNVKLWGWQASKFNANDPHFSYRLEDYVARNVRHKITLLVNDGVLYLYVDDSTEPIVYDLSATYDGGYIYLASNSTGMRYDNLTITDLDNASIEVASVELDHEAVTVDRSAGESLELPACAQITDVKGYSYISPITWGCEDYRSYKEGTFTFTGTVALKGATIAKNADLSALSIEVTNNINGDYDAETSVKYYFDTVEDLGDFTTYASEKVLSDGKLAAAATSEHWTVSNGNLLRKIDGAASTDPNYSEETLAKNVSSIILNARDEQLPLMNFQLDLEYRLAQDSWLWPMVAIGVNDPEQFISKQKSGADYEMQKTGGGMYILTEREGVIQARGAVYNADSERFTGTLLAGADGKPFNTSFDKTKTHTMRIRVYDGTAYISVDGSQEAVVNIDASAWGGYIGFVVQDASVTFDNLTVTALNSEGKVVPLSEAENGFSPKNQVDTYLGWAPTREEWYYEWSSDYK